MRSSYRLSEGRLCVYAVLSLSCTYAGAQDALRTALQGDRSARARQPIANPQSDVTKAGPVQFTAGMSYSLEFNDNVNVAEASGEEDWIQQLQLDIHASARVTKNSTLTFGGALGYAKYLNHPENDRFLITPDSNSELAYDISTHDFLITIYDRFNYSQDVTTEAALTGVSEFPRFNNTVGIRATYFPSRWNYQAGYAHDNFLTFSSEFERLNRSSEQFFGRIGYDFAFATRAGIEATGSLTDYEDPAQRDSYSATAGPYLEWTVTDALRASVHAGLTYYAFASSDSAGASSLSGNNDLTSYNASVQIDHRISSLFTHGLSLTHDIRPGVNAGSDLIESTHISYRATWPLTQKLVIAGSIFYQIGDEPQITPTGSTGEKFGQFGTTLSTSFPLSQKLSSVLTYSFVQRTSNQADRNYEQNRVSLSLRYRF